MNIIQVFKMAIFMILEMAVIMGAIVLSTILQLKYVLIYIMACDK